MKSNLDRIKARVVPIIRASRNAQGDISIYPVSYRAGRFILKAMTPNGAYCVKAFDREDDAAQTGFDREVAMLRAACGSVLVPTLIGHNSDDALLVMDWIDGPTLGSVLGDTKSREIGVSVGTWIAQFSSLMPQTEAGGSWFAYLSNYDEFGSGAALGDRRAVLEAMPIRNTGIAKNDGHLDNFIVQPGGQLVGIDFAEARLKPLGWDVLLTARSLRRELGEEAKPVIDGLVKGWCDGTDGVDKASFKKLVRLFLRGLDIQTEADDRAV